MIKDKNEMDDIPNTSTNCRLFSDRYFIWSNDLTR